MGKIYYNGIIELIDTRKIALDENKKLKEENKLLREFLNLVDFYEGEIIDGKRFEAESIIELGELARKTLAKIKGDKSDNN